MPEMWTGAQRNAWSYIEYAVGEGYSRSEALSEYRAGGGKIRTQDWYRAYERYQSSSEEWNKVMYLKNADTVPASYFADSPIQYNNKYVIQYRGTVRDPETHLSTELYRQVESDRLLTWDEWQRAMRNNLAESAYIEDAEVMTISEISFFARGKVR